MAKEPRLQVEACQTHQDIIPDKLQPGYSILIIVMSGSHRILLYI